MTIVVRPLATGRPEDRQVMVTCPHGVTNLCYVQRDYIMVGDRELVTLAIEKHRRAWPDCRCTDQRRGRRGGRRGRAGAEATAD